MPAETSETARLRRSSNQPVTAAIIGAKTAPAATPWTGTGRSGPASQRLAPARLMAL